MRNEENLQLYRVLKSQSAGIFAPCAAISNMRREKEKKLTEVFAWANTTLL